MHRYIKGVVKRKRRVLKIAHRGASRYAPENTLVAVTEAMRLGADAIEIDVHRTKMGKLLYSMITVYIEQRERLVLLKTLLYKRLESLKK